MSKPSSGKSKCFCLINIHTPITADRDDKVRDLKSSDVGHVIDWGIWLHNYKFTNI